jgi:dephospho-CoA kinase
VDKVLVVSCKPETQLARIMARVAGSTREAAQKRMDSQMPLCEKTGLADYVIDSDQRIESEAADVLRLYELLRRDGV